MQTITLQLDDSLYEKITSKGIDIQEQFEAYLFEVADDGFPTITTEEAKKRVSKAVEDYRNGRYLSERRRVSGSYAYIHSRFKSQI